MRRPRLPTLLTLAALAGLAAALALAACTGDERPSPPLAHRNLVVVMIDTLRSDHLPSYGYERDTAPFLERLASEGVQVQGYSASSWTRPSVATLLTGHVPQRHQTISRTDSLPETLPYLPDLLDRAGWTTAAWVGNLNVGRKWGFARGFDRFGQTRPVGKADADEVNRGTLEMLPELEPPYFLYVHYVDPHDPYRPPVPWGVDDAGDWAWTQPRRLIDRERPADEHELQRLRDQYDGEIADVDAAVAELFAALDEAGLLDETLVVVTSDHGEEFGEHGDLTHGRTLYEEVLRVPLVLWGRPALPPCSSEAPLHQVDVAPTLLSALGQPVPDGLTGRDRWSDLVHCRLQATDGPDYFHLDLDGRGALAARDGDLKLLLHWRSETGGFDLLPFDLATDPGESRPQPFGAWSDALGRSLHAHHEEEGAQAPSRLESRLDRELDPEDWQALAALGYVDVDDRDDELGDRVLPELLPAFPGPAVDHE